MENSHVCVFRAVVGVVGGLEGADAVVVVGGDVVGGEGYGGWFAAEHGGVGGWGGVDGVGGGGRGWGKRGEGMGRKGKEEGGGKWEVRQRIATRH